VSTQESSRQWADFNAQSSGVQTDKKSRLRRRKGVIVTGGRLLEDPIRTFKGMRCIIGTEAETSSQ